MIQLITFLKKCLQRRDAIQKFIASEEENEALACKWMEDDEQQYAEWLENIEHADKEIDDEPEDILDESNYNYEG
jgi:predicted acetyltransferase